MARPKDPVNRLLARMERKQRRQDAERPPVPGREGVTAGALMVLVVVAFWTPGIVRWYGQIWAFLLAAGAFLTLFLPLPNTHRMADSISPRENLRALLRFPIFWLGCALLAYVWLQLANPAFRVVFGQFGEYTDALVPLDFKRWLPRGIVAPLEETNPFRHLMQFGAAMLITCTVWVGIRHRRTLMVLLMWIVGNGFAWALWAMIQHMLKYTKIHGFYAIPPEKLGQPVPFWGTFVYASNSAAFLNLLIAACLALFFYHERQSRIQQRSGGPHLLWLACAVLMSVSSYMTITRASLLFTSLVLLGFLGIFMVDVLRSKRWRALTAAVGVAVFFLVGLGAAWRYGIFDQKRIQNEWGTLMQSATKPEDDERSRNYKVIQVVLEQNWVWGWGAGSFRYVYPIYQEFYPEVKARYKRWVQDPQTKKWSASQTVVVRWDYCHNDWLQFPLELGAIGAGVLGSILVGWFGYCCRRVRQVRAEHAMLAVGLAGALLHSFVDFNLHMSLIHLTFALLVVMLCKWLQLGHQRGSDAVQES